MSVDRFALLDSATQLVTAFFLLALAVDVFGRRFDATVGRPLGLLLRSILCGMIVASLGALAESLIRPLPVSGWKAAYSTCGFAFAVLIWWFHHRVITRRLARP